MSNEFYSLARTYGGLSLEYADVKESDFASAAASAYSPSERGDFRRVDGTRKIQLLMECPGVVESFQTSAGTIVLPANDVSTATNDAGDGRLFFFRNSGTGAIAIEDYFGSSLHSVPASTTIIIIGNTANTWDFIAPSVTTFNTPSTQLVDQANAQGVSPDSSRADHIHSIPTATPTDVGSANAQGIATTTVKSDHVHRGVHSLKATATGTQRFGDITLEKGSNIVLSDNGLGSFIISTLDLSITVTSASTLTLTAASTAQQVFTGVTVGQNVDLPDATTLDVGRLYFIWNDSTKSIDVRNSTSASIFIVPPHYRGIVTLTTNATAAGVWTWMMMSESEDLSLKSGVASSGSFTGSPKTALISFATPFFSNLYAIVITGSDKRSWSYDSKTVGGFTIEANAATALTAEVSWHAILIGENS